MTWLNYHHLHYFWMVAREGSIARASAQLQLAPPTISGQIHALEEALGEKLFTRVGRHLVLTEMGRIVFRYADEIFTLGRELIDTLQGRPQVDRCAWWSASPMSSPSSLPIVSSNRLCISPPPCKSSVVKASSSAC